MTRQSSYSYDFFLSHEEQSSNNDNYCTCYSWKEWGGTKIASTIKIYVWEIFTATAWPTSKREKEKRNSHAIQWKSVKQLYQTNPKSHRIRYLTKLTRLATSQKFSFLLMSTNVNIPWEKYPISTHKKILYRIALSSNESSSNNGKMTVLPAMYRF